MAHKHSVYDSDTHFSIDPVTRVISNEGSAKNVLIVGDHNAERFTFELPRYLVDGHDMSLCNRVEVHYINADKMSPEKNRGVYECTDFGISPDSEDVVICSWLISREATKYVGLLSFALRFACLSDDGVEEYKWSTAIHQGFAISDGIHNTEYVAEEYADILAQWKIEIEAKIAEGGSSGSGGMKTVTAFPETANEGDVVLLHRCNEITPDDSNSGVILDIPAILALGVPDGYDSRIWEIEATNSKGIGFYAMIEIRRIDDYILTALLLIAETVGGRWYWKNGEFTTDIYGGEKEPPQITNIPLSYVDDFTFTKTLYDIDNWDTPDTDETVIFRTLPVHYGFIGGKWQLTEPSKDVTRRAIEKLQKAVEDINGGIDEIETLIDNSGVLE